MILLLVLVALSGTANCLDNGYGRLPGMGHDLDYATLGPSRGNASYILSLAEFLTTPNRFTAGKTPLQLGYWMIETDSLWDLPDRNASGYLVPDPSKYPDGIESVVTALHRLGLGFGLYGDRGTKDCNGHPGQLGHETKDAEYFASLKIDWFKEDSCYATGTPQQAIAEYATMRDALNKTGHRIWFALCGWKPWYAPRNPSWHYAGGPSLGNSFRIGPDTGSGWAAVLTNFASAVAVAHSVGPSEHGGGWSDGSLLLNPGMGCSQSEMPHILEAASRSVAELDSYRPRSPPSPALAALHARGAPTANCMTTDRFITMFSMWSICALNLVMTGNLPAILKATPQVIEVWMNPEVIAIDQDPGYNAAVGRYPRRVDDAVVTSRFVAEDLQPAHVAECGGEPDGQVWSFGRPVAGYLDNTPRNLCLSIADCDGPLVYDACEIDPHRRTCAGPGKYTHFQWHYNTSSMQLSSYYNTHMCVASGSGLVMKPCSTSDKTQRWTFMPNGQLADYQGHCLTTDAPAPVSDTAVIGRPLGNGDVALLFFNNKPTAQNVTCSPDCLARAGVPGIQRFVVRDVVRRQAAGYGHAGAPLVRSLDAYGASDLLRLSFPDHDDTSS